MKTRDPVHFGSTRLTRRDWGMKRLGGLLVIVMSTAPAALLVTVLFSPALAAADRANPTIGVFYYPGWRNNVLGNVSPTPWAVIRKFPDREPMLGYYDDGAVTTIERQLDWMADAGIAFVALDWYWNRDFGVLKPHTLAAYFKAANRQRVRISILWANHTDAPRDRADFRLMVGHWLDYFRSPEYFRIEGQPVVFVFSAAHLEERAQSFGATAVELLETAQATARAAGERGIFFVGGAATNSSTVLKHAAGTRTGYAAFTAYNLQGPGTHPYPDGHTQSHSFQELEDGYRDHWRWMLTTAKVPYLVPMTVGWDRRPWGGSADPLHDQSRSTPEEFEEHLAEGRRVIEEFAPLTRRIGVICCWNEYGEGSFIEPTRRGALAYLRRVAHVFGPEKREKLLETPQ